MADLPFGLITPAVTGALSLYERIRGKAPTADFAPGEYGVVLHVENKRDETVIIEDIGAVPALLGFSAGQEVEDITRAVVRVRRGADTDQGAIAVLEPAKAAELQVITFDPFKDTPADQKIKVTLRWRASSRSMFSERTISKTITVKDVIALQDESDKRRLRPRR
jgi:hypothetical protein